MGGIDLDKIGETYALPDDVEPATAIAVGYQGDPEVLPGEKDRAREANPRTRKPLAEFAFAADCGKPRSFD